MPRRQRPRRRLWLNDGSCVRLRPTHRNHVWSYDLAVARTREGRPIRLLVVIDEHTRECLAIEVDRQINSDDALHLLAWLFASRGAPQYIRSDNGSEFTAKAVREWLARIGVETLYIEPGSPWENGYVESLIGSLRDELLRRDVFDTLLEGKMLVERWRRHYNEVRPHRSLGYRPPAPAAIRPLPPGSGALRQPAMSGTNIETGTRTGGWSIASGTQQ